MSIAPPSRKSPVTTAAKPGPTRLVLGRRATLALAGTVALTVIWAGGATWFILARDDLAHRVFAREAEIRYGYEDRLKAMRDEVERAVTQNLVERRAVGSRLDGLARRQAEIEERQLWLRQIAERVPGLGRRIAEDSAPERGAVPAAGQLPRSATAYAPTAATNALPEPFALRLRDVPATPAEEPAAPRDRLSMLEGAANSVSADEIRLIDALRLTAEERLARLRAAIGATGLDPDRERSAKAVGGPLVPLPRSAAGAFGALAAELNGTFEELDRTLAAARSLPLGRPLAGDMEMTSPFGYRLDPFTRAAALHTGADFRAEAGASVRAAAAGKVTAAEYAGGYGNLVEIDHGGGVVTRYGHLSGYAVSPGDRVKAGEVVGYAGSTGRSTGSHLHYETRISGEPVNPVRFLEAGTQVASLLAEAR